MLFDIRNLRNLFILGSLSWPSHEILCFIISGSPYSRPAADQSSPPLISRTSPHPHRHLVTGGRGAWTSVAPFLHAEGPLLIS